MQEIKINSHPVSIVVKEIDNLKLGCTKIPGSVKVIGPDSVKNEYDEKQNIITISRFNGKGFGGMISGKNVNLSGSGLMLIESEIILNQETTEVILKATPGAKVYVDRNVKVSREDKPGDKITVIYN